MRWFLLALLAVAGGAALGLWQGWIEVPPRYDIRAPLDLRAEPTFITPWKIARLRRDPALCSVALDTSSLRWAPVPDREAGAGCALENAVRLRRGAATVFSSGFLASCPLAVAFALFEEKALQPAAERHFGQGVARIEHLGSYACRNLYGRAEARRSEHASANALDVAGFVLADGTRISVARDWDGEGVRARFLRAVRDGACRFFHSVLGPEYNAAHRDHFHLDMGRYRACR
jgi:hypothetical protein